MQQIIYSNNLDVRNWKVFMGKHFRLIPDDTELLRYMESIHVHPDYKGFNETKVKS